VSCLVLNCSLDWDFQATAKETAVYSEDKKINQQNAQINSGLICY